MTQTDHLLIVGGALAQCHLGENERTLYQREIQIQIQTFCWKLTIGSATGFLGENERKWDLIEIQIQIQTNTDHCIGSATSENERKWDRGSANLTADYFAQRSLFKSIRLWWNNCQNKPETEKCQGLENYLLLFTWEAGMPIYIVLAQHFNIKKQRRDKWRDKHR